MNIFLIGFRCAGKTSVGRRLASAGGLRFVDTDRVIAAAQDMSIAQIVARRGWEHFRDLEREVIRRVGAEQGQVVATGGGVVLDRGSVKRMRASGRVVWLQVSAAVVQSRMRRDPGSSEQRPSLTGEDTIDEIENVLAQRNRLYAAAADVAVETDRLPVTAVARLVRKRLRGMNGKL